MNLDSVTTHILNIIDTLGFVQKGAYNLRYNGQPLCHGDSDNITIKKKEDKPGIDVYISSYAQKEEVHIPVVISESGLTDIVFNDFYIKSGADVMISAGCGIHNDGCNQSRHDGIHAFHVGKGAQVRYEEKHYGEGEGTGAKILNPATEVYLDNNASFILDTAQIGGVDSAVRTTKIVMGPGSRLSVTERLMTHDGQKTVSDITVLMDGTGSSAHIVSRSVAKGSSEQVFHPKAVGNALCHAHIQCDSIMLDSSMVTSIPEISAGNIDAQIIHEAAIGRINQEQIMKLRTLGLTEEEAERVIIENFLR